MIYELLGAKSSGKPRRMPSTEPMQRPALLFTDGALTSYRLSRLGRAVRRSSG